MSLPPTDTREIARKAERRLLFWVIFFLVVVGAAAIALVYGPGAALVGLACLAAGAAVIGLLWGVLTLMERWVNREP